jgi:beta-N-acetylhexosaminidase
MIAGDYEWGLSMRIDSTVDFSRQIMLGAVQNDLLIYEYASEIARQCKRIGIHINFAPVIDVNNNAK